MLTASARDPNRKDALERKAAHPTTFGRTKIPKLRETVVVGGASDASANEALEVIEEYKANLKAARVDVITAREDLAVAESNLSEGNKNNVSKKELKALESTASDNSLLLSAAEEALDELLNAD